MAARTHSNDRNPANDQELARARTMRTVMIVLAVVAMAVLVYGFGMGWKPWYQVPAGLAAYIFIEWQRHYYKKIKALSERDAD